MRELKKFLKKRWVWGIGVFVLFTLVFMSFFAWRDHTKIEAALGDPGEYALQDEEGNIVGPGGTLIMRRAEEIYRIMGLQNVVGNITWTSQNPNVIDIKGGTYDPVTGFTTGTGQQLELQVKAMTGFSAINIDFEYKDADGNIVPRNLSFRIEVAFSIQEHINPTLQGVKMVKNYPGSERKSLLMDYNSSISVGNADASNDFLRLVFGDGTSENAVWESSDTSVIRVYRPDPDINGGDASNIRIQAVGVGTAKLTVTFSDKTRDYEDTIDVYVRPEITIYDVDKKDNIKVGGKGNPGPKYDEPITVENQAKIDISTLRNTGIGGDVIWVISKTNEQTNKPMLVQDSLKNTGEDAEDATLVYLQDKKQYRLDAKAGRYTIEFYPNGTYKNFEDAHPDNPEEVNPNKSNIDPISFDVDVNCDFKDKEIVISLGGSYSLSEAFNIPLKKLIDENQFEITPVVKNDEYNSNNYIKYDYRTAIISAIRVGEGKIQITPKPDTSVPGLRKFIDPDKGYITVTVRVADTFSLNISQATIPVGKTLDLYGVIGSNTDAQPSQFVWTVSEEGYVTLETNGQYATVHADKETPPNMRPPLRVSLAWTDTEGITWVADCNITITQSAGDFTITPDDIRLEVGESEYLQTSLTGSKDVLWVSSDTSIVTVEPQVGNIAAKVTATNKTGSVVITAINKDNDTYATAVVTVTAPITDIQIDKGPAFTTSIDTPFVFLEAIYQPTNATSTEMIWESSDKTVATVDEKTGMVTVLKLGQTTITVKPVYNPNGVFAQCILTVVDVPITAIKTDVTTLNMQKGDTYDVAVTLTPVNPTDRTLTWTSSKTSVATVDANGRITAVAVGTATIIVQGGNANPVMIEVNVRERLTSIAFEETSVSIAVKETKKLNVIYTPDSGVNKNLIFYSSDTSVVTVAADGTITGMKIGQAMITCIAEDLGEYRPITCNITVTQEIIKPTAFTVDPLEKTIQAGETFQITPIFTPENTSNKEVRYQALDESIATVDETGLVTGVMKGQTFIQIIAAESNLTAMCSVTVEDAVEFSLSPNSREIALGRTFRITKVTNPSNVDKSAIWQTSNSKIASINSSGVVTGKKIGSCTITCTLKKYKQSATCRVKVAKLKSTLKLDKTSIRMNVGSTYRLKKTVWSNNTSTPSVVFTSQNSKVASVGSSSGKIKAKKIGSTVITAKTKDDVRATARCRVTVIHRSTGISLNKTYAVCHIGRTIKLNATVKPKNSSIKKVKWASSDTNIASVTGSGKITGYAEGDVYITATTTDGSNKSARCFVRVSESVPATSILVAQPELTMKKGNTAQLSYTILPDNNTDSVKMASDNKHVATVTNDGKVKAVGTGTATVTITTSSGIVTTVDVNVVALNKTSVEMRQYDTETLMVMGTDDNITWYSANNRIATVTGGRVVGRSIGTTYVYAFVNGCKMGCKVKVVSVNSK